MEKAMQGQYQRYPYIPAIILLKIGGRKVSDSVMKIMAVCLSHLLASTYQKRKKGKKNFSNLQLYKVIVRE
jgi:hypothetical protein